LTIPQNILDQITIISRKKQLRSTISPSGTNVPLDFLLSNDENTEVKDRKLPPLNIKETDTDKDLKEPERKVPPIPSPRRDLPPVPSRNLKTDTDKDLKEPERKVPPIPRRNTKTETDKDLKEPEKKGSSYSFS